MQFPLPSPPWGDAAIGYKDGKPYVRLVPKSLGEQRDPLCEIFLLENSNNGKQTIPLGGGVFADVEYEYRVSYAHY
jgi:hypothetical protein